MIRWRRSVIIVEAINPDRRTDGGNTLSIGGVGKY
jgi:hypothetical protein